MDILIILQTALLYVIRGILQFLDQEGIRLTPDNIAYVQREVMENLTHSKLINNVADIDLIQSTVQGMLLDKLVMLPEDILRRSNWNAIGPKSERIKLSQPFESVVIHGRESGQVLSSKEECLKQMKTLQDQQMNEMNKNDIMYNFVLCGNAHVLEGTGWEEDTLHAPELGRKSLGVAFLGQSLDPISKVSLKVLELLLQDGVTQGNLLPNYKVYAHSSTCPGEGVTSALKQLPHWSDVKPVAGMNGVEV